MQPPRSAGDGAARRRSTPSHDRAPRPHPRRRLRVAARQGVARGDGYLEAENAYTQERTAHLADLRQTIFDEIKARTRETDLSVPTRNRGLLVLRPLLRGQGVRRQLPGPGHRPGRLDAAAARRGHRARPAGAARRAGAARPRRAGRGPRVLLARRLARSAPTATLLAYSTDVVGDERYTIRVKDLAHRRAARRRDHRRHRRRHLGPRRREPLLHDRRRVLARRQDLAAPARHRPGRRRAGPPRDRRPVLGRRRPDPQRPVPGDRVRLQDHLGVPLPRRRRARAGLAGRSPSAARAWSTPSTTR